MLTTLPNETMPCTGCGAQLSPGRGKAYGWQSLPDLSYTSDFLAKRFPLGTAVGADDFLRLCSELGHEWSSMLLDDLTSNGWFSREARLELALRLPKYVNDPSIALSYTAWWCLFAELSSLSSYLRDGVPTWRPTGPITAYRGAMCDGESAANLLWSEHPGDAWRSCPGRDELWTAELNPEWVLASFTAPSGGRLWVHDSGEIELAPGSRRT